MFRRVVAPTRKSLALATVLSASRSLTYVPRTRETKYLLDDVYDMYAHYDKLEGDGEKITKDLMESLLDEGARMASQVFFPTYQSGDSEGCHFNNGEVTTPKGVKEAYNAYVEGGFTSLNFPTAYGGQGLPSSVGFLIRDQMVTANYPLNSYAGLSGGAVNTINHWGSEELKSTYLPKIVSGEWSGTMCLTEPQCGTDLSQVKTKAEKNADGTYKINGTKIFITSGEHDLTSNIIHIVLARLPGSDPTTKGLSLFLVPRNLIQKDGSLAKEKNVKCIGIEEKMGIKCGATCQLSFEDSVGYLIGEENAGMKSMFTFMNGARMGVAMQGVGTSEIAFQNALNYARERGSQRAMSGVKCPDKKQDPIIYHSNIRHHLLFAKAVAEGGRALIVDLSKMLDIVQTTKDKKLAKALDDEIAFYTPIAKGCLTEWGLEAAIRCQQVWGGHGYIKGNGMEQIVRDARIATMYEGTTAIQANDFIGRKVLSGKGGDGPKLFVAKLTKLIESAKSDKVLGNFAKQLEAALKQWQESIPKLAEAAKQNRDAQGAAAEDFLMYSGYITLSYYWLRMAEVSAKKIAAGQDADGFHQAKVDTCQYVFERVLPRTQAHYEIMLAPPSAGTFKHETWDLN